MHAANDAAYETGDSVEVVAFHCQPGLPPPEGVPHSHRYRLAVTLTGDALDEEGMLVDLDRLGAVMRDVAGRIDQQDLDVVVGPSTTVERLAHWVHGRLSSALGPGTDRRLLAAVRVWESDTAFGGYCAPLVDR